MSIYVKVITVSPKAFSPACCYSSLTEDSVSLVHQVARDMKCVVGAGQSPLRDSRLVPSGVKQPRPRLEGVSIELSCIQPFYFSLQSCAVVPFASPSPSVLTLCLPGAEGVVRRKGRDPFAELEPKSSEVAV